MTNIKILLVAPNELKSERVKFETDFYKNRNDWHDLGLTPNLYTFDHLLPPVSLSDLQIELDKHAIDADIIIFLADQTLDKSAKSTGLYTEAEFEAVFGKFSSTKKPLIFTYLKEPLIDKELYFEDQIKLFQTNKPSSDLTCSYHNFKDGNDLWNLFNKQFYLLNAPRSGKDQTRKNVFKFEKKDKEDFDDSWDDEEKSKAKHDIPKMDSQSADEGAQQQNKKSEDQVERSSRAIPSGKRQEEDKDEAKPEVARMETTTSSENAPDEAKTSAEQGDEVNCTLYAPREVTLGDEFLVQVFAHTDEQSSLIEPMAHLADDTSTNKGTTPLLENLEWNTKIDFNLVMEGLTIDEPVLSVVWKGKVVFVQFAVKVPLGFSTSDIVGRVIIAKASVPIGKIKFKLKILSSKSDVNAPETKPSSNKMEKFKLAFISYSSHDRQEVLKRVQMLNLIHLQFFQDLLTLESGELWADKIYENIDSCDVFFLFWSKAASQSPWVSKEVIYAIQKKKSNWDSPPEIVPVIIEGPPPAKPPEELKALHFNDKFIYFINSRDQPIQP